MKINLSKIFIIYKPNRFSEKVDVYDGKPSNMKSLANQFKGGLSLKSIHAMYSTKSEADKEAKRLFKKHKILK